MVPSPKKHHGSDAARQGETTAGGDTAASRDPRLATVTQPPDLAQQLRDFASQVSAVSMAEAERDSIVKRLRQERESKIKAEKRQFSFPSTVSRHRLAMASAADEKVLVERKLEEHRTRQENLVQALAANIGGAAKDPLPEARMKEDIDTVREQANRADVNARQANEDLGKKMVEVKEDKVSMRNELDSLSNRLDSAKRSIDSLAAAEPTPCKHEESIRNLEERLKTNQEAMSQKLEELKQIIPAQETLTKMSTDAHTGWEATAAILSTEQKDFASTLQKNFQNLSDQFQSHRQLQENRDNSISDELESTQTSLQQLEAKLEALSQNFASVQKIIAGLQQHPSNAVSPTGTPGPVAQVQQPGNNTNSGLESIKGNLAKQEQSIGALNVAVHSLQSRYNNMTSEPIVRQMASVLQSMYPYASTAQQDIEYFKGELTRTGDRIGALHDRLEAAEKLTSQAKIEREGFLNDMNSEKDKLLRHMEVQDGKIKAVEEVFDNLKKEKEHSTAEQLASLEDRLSSKMTELQKTLAQMEEEVSDQLAKILWDSEQLDEQKKKVDSLEKDTAGIPPLKEKLTFVLEVIGHLGKRVEQELGVKAASEPMDQTRNQAANGHQSPGKASPDDSATQSGRVETPKIPSFSLQNVPTGPKARSNPVSSSTNRAWTVEPQQMGPSPTQKSNPNKKRKKNGAPPRQGSQ